MSERITRDALEQMLRVFCNATGRRIANPDAYPDVGGYFLHKTYPNRYAIAQYVSKGGGINLPFGSRNRTAREMYDQLSFAIDVAREPQFREVTA